MEQPDWSLLVEATKASASGAVELLGHPAVAQAWQLPSALPRFSVGGLASHIGQMLGALANWLEADPPSAGEVRVLSLSDGYGTAARLAASEGLEGRAARTIRDWAADWARQGPAAVHGRARADLERAGSLLRSASPDRLIPSAILPGAASRLSDYLRTRCVEFVVHGDDLAASVEGLAPVPDPAATAVALDALVELCRTRAGDLGVLRALARPERADPEALRAL